QSQLGWGYIWTLLQHRPSMRDGPSFLRHTQSRLPRYPTLSRISTRSLSSEESRHVVRKVAQPLDPSTAFFPERPHTIRIGQEKRRAVPCSIGICQPQPTAVCRSAREFASPI